MADFPIFLDYEEADLDFPEAQPAPQPVIHGVVGVEFACPVDVCQQTYARFDLLERHFGLCFAFHEGEMSPNARIFSQDRMAAFGMHWEALSEDNPRLLSDPSVPAQLVAVETETRRLQALKRPHNEEEEGEAEIEPETEPQSEQVLVEWDFDVQCGLCGEMGSIREMSTGEHCCGTFVCFDCLSFHIRTRLANKQIKLLDRPILCPVEDCSVAIPQHLMRKAVGDELAEQIERRSVREVMESDPSFVFCPNCEFGWQVDPRSAKDVRISIQEARLQEKLAKRRMIEESGGEVPDIMSPILAPTSPDVFFEQYRFRCRNCGENFCAHCKQSPFHEGFTCESWEEHKKMRKCRFCDLAEVPGDEVVCQGEECQAKAADSCGKTLPCGHLCGGSVGEEECLTCLKCEGEEDQGGEDYCNICWVEDLNAAPCLRLNCGHIFHYRCLVTKLEKKWPGPTVTWTFLRCPLCKEPITGERHESGLAEIVDPLLAFREKIGDMGLRRLEVQGMMEDKAITDEESRFYQNPRAFAESRLAYYVCFECKEPYFGGLKSCQGDAEAAQDDAAEFKEEDLICGGCCGGGEGVSNCAIHGVEFIQWKCRFCCSLAVWFCFGTTHFCEPCHRNHSVMCNKPKEELDKCPGPGECAAGGRHKPNGEEYSLGCTVCGKDAKQKEGSAEVPNELPKNRPAPVRRRPRRIRRKRARPKLNIARARARARVRARARARQRGNARDRRRAYSRARAMRNRRNRRGRGRGRGRGGGDL